MEDKARKKRILIVDDEPANMKILVKALRETYKLIISTNGFQALELIEVNPPDMILLDIEMPGIDGFEVCKRLKQNEKTKDIPVVFITAIDEGEEAAKGLALGALDYIPKPFDVDTVVQRVKSIIGLAQK